MRKLLTKKTLKIFIGIIVFFISLTLLTNLILFFARKSLLIKLESQSPVKTEVGGVFYVFPNIIWINNIDLGEKEGHLEVGSAFVKFSLLKLITRREFSATAVNVNSPHASTVFLKDVWNKYGEKIIELVEKMPLQDVNVYYKDVQVTLLPENGHRGVLRADVNFLLRGQKVALSGWLRKDRFRMEDGHDRFISTARFFDFRYEGILDSEGMVIDSLVLYRPGIFAKFWGGFLNQTLELNGFAFVDTLTRLTENRPILSYFQRLKDSLGVTRPIPSDYAPKDSDLNLFDVNVQAGWSGSKLLVRRCRFAVNNSPVDISGSIDFSGPLRVKLKGGFQPPSSGSTRLRNFKQADFDISGTTMLKGFLIDGSMGISFVRNKKGQGLEKINTDFKGLALRVDRYGRLTADLKRFPLTFITNGNPHILTLDGLRVSANMQAERIKIFDFKGPFYGGKLDGRMWMDSGSVPTRLTSLFRIHGADVNRLKELLVHFGSFQGNLSGEVRFQNYSGSTLTGNVTISHGHLKGFQFFDWMGDTFQLPYVKSFDFQHASSRFEINGNKTGLYDINLTADGLMKIDGYFVVDAESFVSSKISLWIYRPLAQQSPKLRMVINMLGREADLLDLDFQLSGPHRAMNFQWLPSKTKEKIQKKIPDFIERIIERKVDSQMTE